MMTCLVTRHHSTAGYLGGGQPMTWPCLDHWNSFCRKPGLIRRGGFHPTLAGASHITRDLADFINTRSNATKFTPIFADQSHLTQNLQTNARWHFELPAVQMCIRISLPHRISTHHFTIVFGQSCC